MSVNPASTLIIACCAADGVPLGILVKLLGKMELQNGEWIGAEGTLQLLPFNEKPKSIEPLVNLIPPEKNAPYSTVAKAYK